MNDSVGALVPVEDADALADAITGTLQRADNDPSWRTKIAEYAASYSQANIVCELEELYRSVLS